MGAWISWAKSGKAICTYNLRTSTCTRIYTRTYRGIIKRVGAIRDTTVTVHLYINYVLIEPCVHAHVSEYIHVHICHWSVDASGKVRIWDTTQKEHILKYEYQPISGVIKDIVWSPDSKRIAVCGEGREK